MSKKARQRSKQASNAGGIRKIAIVLVFAVSSVALVWTGWNHFGRQPGGATGKVPADLSFNKDVAPIIFKHCSECHRPGQAAPFSLLTFADVSKRASDIVEVTQRRYMPPWLPDQPGEFLDERRLSSLEIATIAEWVNRGAVEGRASELPPVPNWSSEWQLGTPDLVVTMPEAFVLPAAGKDIYRNFILPVPLPRARYIRALELRPESKAVHHAFVRFDRTGQCRVLDDQEAGVGFGGMEVPPTVETPPGHFSGWVPGASPMRAPPGLTWQLAPGTDFVLLLHLQPTGKPEPISPRLGLYFTDSPPTNTAVVANLQSFAIDIPAGASDYVVEESLTLPVAADLLAVKPHAHLLGKRLEGLALLPDGKTQTLLRIPQWDFNWQTDYRYVKPISVPAGTVLRLRYSYDNSTNNQRNPNRPPTPVKYGLQTSDEMGELAFQMLARRREDLPKLKAAVEQYQLRGALERNLGRLRDNPQNGDAAIEAGKFAFALGDKIRAEALLRQGLALRPDSADANYSLGIALMDASRLSEAELHFTEALRIDPRHFKARNNAGLCAMRQGRMAVAEAHFREVLRFRPDETVAQGNLDLVLQARRTEGFK